ncbi:hypothetical protein CI102_9078 [Trichoderma harzianum]|nr:hypothetical protein CI102_9078 [Trichoderma harzianum]
MYRWNGVEPWVRHLPVPRLQATGETSCCFFALLCFALPLLGHSSIPLLFLVPGAQRRRHDTQLNHGRTLGGSRRRSLSIQSINPSRNLNSKPAAKRDKSRTASIVGDRVLGHE